MAPPRLVPDKVTIERWIDEGLTHQQMADRLLAETGNKVTRMAISAAIQRYGLAGEGNRYEDTVPWRIQPSHATAQPLRMLRFMGRRRQGNSLNDAESKQLDAWMKRLTEMDVIVAYDPDDDLGFHYIDARFRDHDDATLPIRRTPIHINPQEVN